MSKFLAFVFLLSVNVGLWVLLLVKGFGLEIKSWLWVAIFVVVNSILKAIWGVVTKETIKSMAEYFNGNKKETK